MPNYPKIEQAVIPAREGADWGADPESGAAVFRLTSLGAWSHNIYGEQPYGSPDGRRVLIARTHDPYASGYQLFVADVQTLGITLVEPDVPTELAVLRSWGEWVYYVMRDGSLRRVSLLSFEHQQVLPARSLSPQVSFQSITADEEWLIGWGPGNGEGSRLATFALHLQTQERRLIYEGTDNRNPHVQIEPGEKNCILFQLIRPDGHPRVPVFVCEFPKTRNAAPESTMLPIGDRWTAESSGHMAWIGTTGKVACCTEWDREHRRHDPRHPHGNLVITAPGDEKPRVIGSEEHAYYHVSVSRCGRYFVCDDFMDFRADAFNNRCANGPIRIVVGSISTGRTKVLLRDCQNYGCAGASQFEPDPYFTADNRYVIYSASPFGTMHVFAARLPPGFLESLD